MFRIGDKVEYTARSGNVVYAYVLGIAGKTAVYLGPMNGFVDLTKPHRKSTKHLRMARLTALDSKT